MRGSFIAALLVLAGAGAFVGLRLEVSTDMARFVPAGEDRQQAQLMREFATSELSRSMILLVEAPDLDAAVRASAALETALREAPDVGEQLAFLEGGPPKGLDRAFWEAYQPRRLAFIAETAAQAELALSPDGLKAAAERLRERLAMPLSPLVSRAAPGDPLMVTAGMLDRLQPTRAAGVRVAQGRFVTADEKRAVLFLGTKASAFDATVQRAFVAGVQRAFDKVNAAAGGTLRLRQAGVNRIAVAAEDAIKADIQRVSVISVVTLVTVVLLLFGSLRLVGVTMVPIVAGMVVGTAGCLAVFGAIHGLTLAFGAALIGVCIDYAAHTYCHHQLEGADDPAASVRRVWRGLALGAATTITGFVALGGATFPGLREVAVFGALGVAAALLSTRWLVPPLMGRGGAATRRLEWLAGALSRALAAGRKRRGWLLVLPLVCVGLIVAGAPGLAWNDDLSEFGRVDGPMMAEDQAVREQVAPFEQRLFVVSSGASDEEALQANDAVALRLAAAVEAGELGVYRGAAILLPSAQRQRAVARAVRGDAGVWKRFETVFAGAGFDASAFAPFREALAAEPPAPLTYQDLAGTPIEGLVRPFRVTLGDHTGYVTFLAEVHDREALAARLDGVTGATLLDFAAVITKAYRGYRERMLELLGVGLLAVVLLLGWRYRRPRLVVAALAPSLLAAATTAAVLSLAGVALSVLTVTALLMVVCIGVDYGVFVTETAASDEVRLAPTLAALAVAAVSTLLGFGLLAMSDHPALMSLGLTAAVGVGSAVLLAPTALALVASRDAWNSAESWSDG